MMINTMNAVTIQGGILYAVIAYFAIISIVSVIVTCYDKIAAKKMPQHRTRERTLLLLSALGGSVAMFITMLVIRHKTLHVKFMIGIPVIILIQTIITFLLVHFSVITF